MKHTDRLRYSPQFHVLSKWVRHVRARGQCECTGQCGSHRGKRCLHMNGCPAIWSHGIIHLATAHLCKCDPPCADKNHVIACCQKCHLTIDIAHHLATRAKQTRQDTPGSTRRTQLDP